MPDAADTDAIHPAALRAARKRRGMTQQQLAESIRCTKDTVSRWERGTSRRLRSHLREPLCDALRIRWEKLTEPPKEPADRTASGEARINMSVGTDARNSLYLVAERYEISPEGVIDIAPLLFLIIAELSLQARLQRLKEIYRIRDETTEKLLNDCAHLGEVIAAPSSDAEDALTHEDMSLTERDIFGHILGHGHLDDRPGPFVHFIRDLAKDLPQGAVTSIESFDGDTIDMYRIADDTLRECTGISGDENEDERILRRLRDGGIDLAECLRVKRGGDKTVYRQWLLDALTEAEEETKKHSFSPDDFLVHVGATGGNDR